MIWGLDEPVIKVVTALADAKNRDFGPCHTLAFVEDGQIIGGVIIHDWNPEAGTVEISGGMLKPSFAVLPAIRKVGAYVFGEMGCQAAIMRTAEGNRTVRRLARRLGAQEYIIPRLRGRTASEALLVMTDDVFAGWERHEST